MPFKGITFAGQNVTPKNDGGLYAGYLGDGILWGCEMNISGDDLVIQSGEIIVGGRVIQVDGATSVNLAERTYQTGYIQVILNADMSKGEGMQVYPSFVEQATTTFPTLTFGNINDTDTLHQYELAIIQISGGNLTSIVRTGWPARILMNDDGSGNRVAMFGFWGSNLNAYTYQKGSGTPLAGMRTSDTDNAVIFAPNKPILIRPNGSEDATNQSSFATDGMVTGGGFRCGASSDGTTYRWGDMFMVNGYFSTTTTLPNNVQTTIRTISDAKFRPTSTQYGLAFGWVTKTMALVTVDTNGNIKLMPWQNVSGTSSWIVHCMWRNPSFTP